MNSHDLFLWSGTEAADIAAAFEKTGKARGRNSQIKITRIQRHRSPCSNKQRLRKLTRAQKGSQKREGFQREPYLTDENDSDEILTDHRLQSCRGLIPP